VVIPVYNNQATVRAVALAACEQVPQVVVVDDGSTDADIPALFRDTGIVVLRHAVNQGKGQAILTGLRYVGEQGGRYMITLDADGQHLPADIPKLLAVLAEEPACIVIGARRMDAPNVPSASRFGMRFSDFWLRLETGQAMRDTQSGFRAYPVELISQLNCVSKHYDFEVEILARAAWAGLKVRSVDVEVIYAEPGKRVSHFRPWLDNLRFTRRHAMLVMRRLLPWGHKQLVAPEGENIWALFWHPVRLLKKLMTEHATPAELGMAAAMGVFLGALPPPGLHTVVIIYVASRFRLNRMMGVVTQNICMPPVVPFICIELGYYLRHGEWLREMTMDAWCYNAPARLWEWLLGSLIVGPVLAVMVGLIVFGVAEMIQKKSGNPG
jgi:glycosyltransferase involved in cell wall biosynthesis